LQCLMPTNVLFEIFDLYKGALDLEIFHSPKKVLANTDVLLKCKATNYDKSDLDIKFVAVKWKVIYSSGVQKDLYTFNGGTHAISRPGAKIFDDEILEGNASLYLPNIQLEERGVYFCTVYITPEKEEVTGELLVIGKSVKTYLMCIIIENGTEKSIMCNINRYYPLKIDVKWIHNSGDGKQEVLKSVCRKSPVKNEDGTFNLSSRLTLRPDLTDSGKTYTCLVNHRTLVGGLSKDVLLTVKGTILISETYTNLQKVVCVRMRRWK
uniref:Ig-like domain-containing protein n=1 Tax=Callorhinchus milii TaxID=7868 RepID=A0A4W3IK41_CALMI